MTIHLAVTEAVQKAWQIHTDAPFEGARILRPMGQIQLDYQRPLPFGGGTFNAERDAVRLKEYLQRVYDILVDGEWHSIREIASKVKCSETSAAARIRDLRKAWAGSHEIETMCKEKGLWLYRMVK